MVTSNYVSIKVSKSTNHDLFSLDDQFRVGTKIDIEMDIKPRSTSGVLLSIHGKKDYLILQMKDGAIEFTVDSGRGPVSSTFTPPQKSFFCDGNWHHVHGNIFY